MTIRKIVLVLLILSQVACKDETPSPAPTQTINQASELSWFAPTGSDLNDDTLVDSTTGVSFPTFPDPFEKLRPKLKDLFSRLLNHTKATREDNRSFVELIIQIRKEDPLGLETTPALIAAYRENPDTREGLTYISLLGFLVSENSIPFLKELASSTPEESSNNHGEGCKYAPDSLVIPRITRLAAARNLYHIADLLESQAAQQNLLEVLHESQLYLVRRDAALSLKKLGMERSVIESHMLDEERHILDYQEYDASLSAPKESEPFDPYQEPIEEEEPNDPPSF